MCLSLYHQRNVRQRFSMKYFLMKNFPEVSTSGNNMSKRNMTLHPLHFTASTLSLLLRCTSLRGYRVPPCALVNLSHGARVDHTSYKLTAIVKPQIPTATSFNSQRQLGNLNHSPCSPFIPMQVRGEPQTLYFLFEMKTVCNGIDVLH